MENAKQLVKCQTVKVEHKQNTNLIENYDNAEIIYDSLQDKIVGNSFRIGQFINKGNNGYIYQVKHLTKKYNKHLVIKL